MSKEMDAATREARIAVIRKAQSMRWAKHKEVKSQEELLSVSIHDPTKKWDKSPRVKLIRKSTQMPVALMYKYLSELTGFSKMEIRLFLDAYHALLHVELKNNRVVALPGIGKITPTRTENQKYYNIWKRECEIVPLKITLRFKSDAEMLQALKKAAPGPNRGLPKEDVEKPDYSDVEDLC
jgi:nucleoid DNA-binding protein